MKIKANISYVDYTKYNFQPTNVEKNFICYDENTTLGDIRKMYKIPDNYIVTHIPAYNTDYRAISNEGKIPYIVENETIQWKCDINSTKINSLIETLDIVNDTLVIIYSTGQSGDPYFAWDSIWNWINSSQNALNNICSIVSLVSAVLVPIVKFFSTLRKKQKIETSNFAYVDYILKRNVWTSLEISKLYKINRKTSINLLKFLGYKWDRKHQAFIISNKKRIYMRDKIQKQDEIIESIIYSDNNINDVQSFIDKRK